MVPIFDRSVTSILHKIAVPTATPPINNGVSDAAPRNTTLSTPNMIDTTSPNVFAKYENNHVENHEATIANIGAVSTVSTSSFAR